MSNANTQKFEIWRHLRCLRFNLNMSILKSLGLHIGNPFLFDIILCTRLVNELCNVHYTNKAYYFCSITVYLGSLWFNVGFLPPTKSTHMLNEVNHRVGQVLETAEYLLIPVNPVKASKFRLWCGHPSMSALGKRSTFGMSVDLITRGLVSRDGSVTILMLFDESGKV